MKYDDWGKEPFDLRLTVLRLVRNLPGLLALSIAGTLIFGGIYYIKNVIFRPAGTYSASATFYVEYSNENWAADGTYINYMTWDTWMDSQEFTGYVQKYPGARSFSREELAEMLSAAVPSDHRVPVITVTSSSKETSEKVLEAVKTAMVQDFPGGMRDVESIRVTDTTEAKEDLPDVRPVRAFVLAGVLSVFFVLTAFLLKELLEEKIRLPITLTRRYGLRTPGVMDTAMFAENLRYFTKGKKEVAVCPVETGLDPARIAGYLQDVINSGEDSEKPRFVPLPCLELAPEGVGALRKADGVILAVRSGGRDARHLEAVLDYLQQQDIAVTAALLWDQDRWLLKNYYRFERM